MLVIATEAELPATGFCLVLDWEPDTRLVLLRFAEDEIGGLEDWRTGGLEDSEEERP